MQWYPPHENVLRAWDIRASLTNSRRGLAPIQGCHLSQTCKELSVATAFVNKTMITKCNRPLCCWWTENWGDKECTRQEDLSNDTGLRRTPETQWYSMLTIYTYTQHTNIQDRDISVRRPKLTYGLTSSRHPHSLRQKESKGLIWEGRKGSIDREGGKWNYYLS